MYIKFLLSFSALFILSTCIVIYNLWYIPLFYTNKIPLVFASLLDKCLGGVCGLGGGLERGGGPPLLWFFSTLDDLTVLALSTGVTTAYRSKSSYSSLRPVDTELPRLSLTTSGEETLSAEEEIDMVFESRRASSWRMRIQSTWCAFIRNF